ncbi:MAG: hypothetical protein IJ844_04415, partial [Prevotella sp.]|nr:hypothetical protein [Prevotella sp.]
GKHLAAIGKSSTFDPSKLTWTTIKNIFQVHEKKKHQSPRRQRRGSAKLWLCKATACTCMLKD